MTIARDWNTAPLIQSGTVCVRSKMLTSTRSGYIPEILVLKGHMKALAFMDFSAVGRVANAWDQDLMGNAHPVLIAFLIIIAI